MVERVSAAKRFPLEDGYRVPAEWAAHRRTWMCWPARAEAWSGPAGLLRAKEASAHVAHAIAAFEPVAMAVRPEDTAEARRFCGDATEIFEMPLDDSWARDTGPTFLAGPAPAGVAWQFNAWGGKYHPYDADKNLASRILGVLHARIYAAPLVCEGGAVHVDGEGTLLTTEQCLLNRNRNPGLGREQVEESLKRYSGADCILWLGSDFSDEETDGHVDNIACFAAPGRVIIGVPASKSHPDCEAISAAKRRLAQARDARGRTLEIVEIAQPAKERVDWRGRLLPASYVNFYIVNGGVVMPAFDDPADLAARAVLADCFPDRRIAQLDALDIVQGGGGIHCITQQEPA